MSYRLAESLKKLREQIDAANPGRDKSSDGWIGDAAHASRESDHNPWVKDGKTGVVTAIDIDEDLRNGAKTLQQVVDAICASRDPRVKYIIYEGRITVKGSGLQAWKKYTGANAHRYHAHISVFPKKELYDDTRDWKLEVATAIPDPDDPAAAIYHVVPGDTLSAIARKFKTSVDAIKRANALPSDLIRIGQPLRVK